MPFMGEHSWSSAPSSQGEWSESLYLRFPYSSGTTREARGASCAKTQRPAYVKHKNHASMPQLSRPSTYADEVDRLRHPPAPSKPKRSQSLTSAPMAEHQQTSSMSISKDPKAEKRVHFVDEGYASSSSTPATSPKQEPKSDEDASRQSTSDGDFEQLASQQQKMTLRDKNKSQSQSQAQAQAQARSPASKAHSRSPMRSAKAAAAQAQAQSQRAASSSPRQTVSRSQPTVASKSTRSVAQTARTGGSYRNQNGNICFEEFSYFGGI